MRPCVDDHAAIRNRLSFAVLLLASGLCAAAAMPVPGVAIVGAWARATAPRQDTGAVYLTIRSNREMTLTAVSSRDAEMAMFHRTTTARGMSDMQDVPEVKIPAGGAAVFSPGGMHIMLMGLRHGLVAGDRIGVELVFSDGEKLDVQVPVQSIGASGPPGR